MPQQALLLLYIHEHKRAGLRKSGLPTSTLNWLVPDGASLLRHLFWPPLIVATTKGNKLLPSLQHMRATTGIISETKLLKTICQWRTKLKELINSISRLFFRPRHHFEPWILLRFGNVCLGQAKGSLNLGTGSKALVSLH